MIWQAQASSLVARVGVSAALALACSAERMVVSEPLEIGADTGSASDAGAGPLCGQKPSEGIPLEHSPPALGRGHAGRWLARIFGDEVSQFPSALLELELDPGRAELRFETSASLPTLTDPRGGYLCRAPSASTCATASGFVPSFDYTLGDVAARDSILSFRVFLEQPWNDWCTLQEPVPREIPGCDPVYEVEPAYSDVLWGDTCAVFRGDVWLDIDCDRLATVERHACACSESGCRAAARALQVNLRLVAAGALDGALWFSGNHAQAVHFERQPALSAP